jgi:hypothetical protein
MPYGVDITEAIPYVLYNPVGAASYSASLSPQGRQVQIRQLGRSRIK